MINPFYPTLIIPEAISILIFSAIPGFLMYLEMLDGSVFMSLRTFWMVGSVITAWISGSSKALFLCSGSSGPVMIYTYGRE